MQHKATERTCTRYRKVSSLFSRKPSLSLYRTIQQVLYSAVAVTVVTLDSERPVIYGGSVTVHLVDVRLDNR